MRPLSPARQRGAIRASVSIPPVALVALVAACGGGGSADGDREASAACAADTGARVATAVTDFLKTAQPTPQRYLTAVGTDSALPEPGLQVLQGKGPTYFYPADSVQQGKVREQLASVGDFNTILVVFRGVTQPSPDSAVVRLGGHYVGGKADGQSYGPRSYSFACDSAGWRIAGSAAESGA
jgi:hypothetical protein